MKRMLLNGEIPRADWTAVRNQAQQSLSQAVDSHEKELQELNKLKKQQDELTQQLQQIQIKIGAASRNISDSKSKRDLLDIYMQVLQPISQEEKKLSESFENAKKGRPEDYTVDNVCFFLNECSLSAAVPIILEKQVTGEKLLSIASVSGFHGLTKDPLLASKLEFYSKLLSGGIFYDEEKLNKIPIWRHRETDKTIQFLKEYGLLLNEKTIQDFNISIGQLIYMRAEDFSTVFSLNFFDAVAMKQKMNLLKLEFERHVEAARSEDDAVKLISSIPMISSSTPLASSSSSPFSLSVPASPFSLSVPASPFPLSFPASPSSTSEEDAIKLISSIPVMSNLSPTSSFTFSMPNSPFSSSVPPSSPFSPVPTSSPFSDLRSAKRHKRSKRKGSFNK